MPTQNRVKIYPQNAIEETVALDEERLSELEWEHGTRTVDGRLSGNSTPRK